MTMTIVDPSVAGEEAGTRYAIIDADVHPDFTPGKPQVVQRLPQRWQEYIAEYGILRGDTPGGNRPRHREYASRWDTEPPEGGAPMSNPDFAREQLLDRYGTTAAILNDIGAFQFAGARSTPRELAVEICRAMNDDREEHWFARDERWYGSINAAYEVPNHAVEEIQRRMDSPWRHRWRQVMFAPDNMNPPGHEKYWPIYEICEANNLPVGMHVLASHRVTASGSPNYYFEEHVDWAAYNFPILASLIFEGTFDRFPNLHIALVELAWSWVVPLAWRLDAAYELMKSEVPNLQRKPSEYIRDHFWYTSQPMEEPEKAEWFDEVYEAFEASGMGDKLMYSSDYPHWDFDEPSALPASLGEARRRAILGGNASGLYGIPLKPGSGTAMN